MEYVEINTADEDWSTKIGEAFRNKTSFEYKDDGGTGYTIYGGTLAGDLRKSKLTGRDFVAILIAAGVSAGGATILYKSMNAGDIRAQLALACVGAGLMIFGSAHAIQTLTGTKPISVKVKAHGVEVSFG